MQDLDHLGMRKSLSQNSPAITSIPLVKAATMLYFCVGNKSKDWVVVF